MRPRRPEEPSFPVGNAGDRPPRLAPGKGVGTGTAKNATPKLRQTYLIPGSGCPDCLTYYTGVVGASCRESRLIHGQVPCQWHPKIDAARDRRCQHRIGKIDRWKSAAWACQLDQR